MDLERKNYGGKQQFKQLGAVHPDSSHSNMTSSHMKPLYAQLRSSAAFSSPPAKRMTALDGPILTRKASGLERKKKKK